MGVYGSYKPFAYVKPEQVVSYLLNVAGWVIRPRENGTHGVIVAPSPIASDSGEEIFFPVYRPIAGTVPNPQWSVSADSVHRSGGILATLAAIYGGTETEMAREISGLEEVLLIRDAGGRVRSCLVFGRYSFNRERLERLLPTRSPHFFTMREMTGTDNPATIYGIAVWEEDIPCGGVPYYP